MKIHDIPRLACLSLALTFAGASLARAQSETPSAKLPSAPRAGCCAPCPKRGEAQEEAGARRPSKAELQYGNRLTSPYGDPDDATRVQYAGNR